MKSKKDVDRGSSIMNREKQQRPAICDLPQGGPLSGRSALLVFATKPEASEWKRRGIGFFQVGIGSEGVRRREQALRLLFESGVRFVFHLGLSGALVPELKAGDLFLPTAITNGDQTFKPDGPLLGRLRQAGIKSSHQMTEGTLFSSLDVLETPESKKEAASHHLAQAVDMESFWVAQICARAQIPYLSLRGIFDGMEEDLSGIGEAHLMTSEGNINPMGLLKLPVTHPKLLMQLPRFQSVMNKTNRKLFEVYEKFR